jgi:hypothetical protein
MKRSIACWAWGIPRGVVATGFGVSLGDLFERPGDALAVGAFLAGAGLEVFEGVLEAELGFGSELGVVYGGLDRGEGFTAEAVEPQGGVPAGLKVVGLELDDQLFDRDGLLGAAGG